MKKLFNILPLLLVVLFSSCEDHENKVYSGNVNNFTFLSFDQSSFRLDIAKDGEGELVIDLKSSVTSSVDRVYNIELIAEDSTADPLTYNLPATVTIPANEYVGKIVITGQDLDLVEATPKVFMFKISNLNDKEFMDNNLVTVSVGEVCPLFAPFTGQYRFVNVIPSIDWGPAQPDGTIVNLVATSEFGRQFQMNNFLISGYSFNFKFNLSCGETQTTPYTSTLWCGEAPYYALDAGETHGAYDPENDSEILVTYLDNSLGACGGGPQHCSFKLIKI